MKPIRSLAGLAFATGLLSAAPAMAGEAPAAPAANVPPMGWNPWNAFRTEVTEAKIMAVADTLVKTGLADAGYRSINVDDGWWLKRGGDGRIVVRTSMFPSAAMPDGTTSLRPFTDRLHAMGLKAGLYTDIGRNACSQAWDAKSPNLSQGSQAEREIGSMDHQAADMAQIFGDWNFDYLKVDACGLADFTADKPYVVDGQYRATGPYIVRGHPDAVNDARVAGLYAGLRAAIDAARPKRDYVLAICTWGEAGVDDWGQSHGNLWRTSGDISARWASMLRNFDSSAAHPENAGPGHWNDPDMLEIGNGDFDAAHLTEARAHLSLWAVIGAPLILGSDVTKWPQSLIDIAGNREVIAIDQDSAGHQGVVISRTGDAEVVVKALANGDKAVALINRGAAPVTASVPLSALGFDAASGMTLRDLWAQTARQSHEAAISATLAPHETALLRVSRVQNISTAAQSPVR